MALGRGYDKLLLDYVNNGTRAGYDTFLLDYVNNGIKARIW
jgi:hypothetical protein